MSKATKQAVTPTQAPKKSSASAADPKEKKTMLIGEKGVSIIKQTPGPVKAATPGNNTEVAKKRGKIAHV